MTADDRRAQLLAELADLTPMPDDDALEVEGAAIDRYGKVVRALYDVADESCIEPLVASFGYGYGFELYETTAAILIGLGAERVRAALRATLAAGRRGPRMWAADLLGTVGTQDDVPVLAAALNDPDDLVRGSAATSLGALGGPPAEALVDAWRKGRAAAAPAAPTRSTPLPSTRPPEPTPSPLPSTPLPRIPPPDATLVPPGPQPPPAPVPPFDAPLSDPQTGFRVHAPRGFRLVHAPGRPVYALVDATRGAWLRYARVASDVDPTVAARALAEAAGLARVGDTRLAERAAVVARGVGGGECCFDVRRGAPGELVVTAYGSAVPADRELLAAVAASAQGGPTAALPSKAIAEPVQPIPLTPFVTADGQTWGRVPAEPGWASSGGGGLLQTFHPQRGELFLGVSLFVCPPGGPSATAAETYPAQFAAQCAAIAPPMPCDEALLYVWPQVRKRYEGVDVGVRIDWSQPLKFWVGWSTGIFALSYVKGGQPWHGAAVVATAPTYTDDRWNLRFWHLGVPDTDDSSVAQALVNAWEAYYAPPAPPQATISGQPPDPSIIATVRSLPRLQPRAVTRQLPAWDVLARDLVP